MGSALSSLFGGEASTKPASSPSENSRVVWFHSSEQWKLHFNEVKDSSKLIVIDFSASWCGPCRFMEPVVHALAEKFTDVEFLSIDVDELSDVAQEFRVEAMPTFVLMKRGEEIDRVVGAKKDELKKKIVEHTAVKAAA